MVPGYSLGDKMKPIAASPLEADAIASPSIRRHRKLRGPDLPRQGKPLAKVRVGVAPGGPLGPYLRQCSWKNLLDVDFNAYHLLRARPSAEAEALLR